MAKKDSKQVIFNIEKKKIKRKMRHSKKKSSKLKTSKNYSKVYRGQGK
jgi:hypothetical protein